MRLQLQGRQRALSRVRRFKIDSKRKKENEDQVKENKKLEKLKKRDLQVGYLMFVICCEQNC